MHEELADEYATRFHEAYGNEPVDVLPNFATQPTHRLAREEAVLDAMCAFDAFARGAIAPSRNNLTKTQFDIVIRLSLYSKMNMTQIASDLAVSNEHVTRAIAALVDMGFVEKSRNPHNKRMVEASLTSEGDAFATAFRKQSIERLNARLARISDEEKEALLQASETACGILRKITVPK